MMLMKFVDDDGSCDEHQQVMKVIQINTLKAARRDDDVTRTRSKIYKQYKVESARKWHACIVNCVRNVSRAQLPIENARAKC